METGQGKELSDLIIVLAQGPVSFEVVSRQPRQQ